MSKAVLPSLDAPLWSRWLLSGLLPLILFAVIWDGLHYDPQRSRLEAGGSADQVVSLPAELAGMPRFGQTRLYDADDLYEYINGHAEYYLSSGFRSLQVIEYAVDGEQQPQLVINLYDLGEPLFAFGVLMGELAPGAKPLELGTMAFAVENGVNLIHGRYYIQLSSFDAGIDLVAVGKAVVEQSDLGDVEGLDLSFPSLGETLETYFVKEDFRGLEFLDLVLERTFQRDGAQFSAFLINAKPERIETTRQALLDFLGQDGIPFEQKTAEGVVYYDVDDPYEGRWFFTAGEARLLGVFTEPAPGLLQGIAAGVAPAAEARPAMNPD